MKSCYDEKTSTIKKLKRGIFGIVSVSFHLNLTTFGHTFRIHALKTFHLVSFLTKIFAAKFKTVYPCQYFIFLEFEGMNLLVYFLITYFYLYRCLKLQGVKSKIVSCLQTSLFVLAATWLFSVSIVSIIRQDLF